MRTSPLRLLQGELVLDPTLPHFSPEEQTWRQHHFTVDVPEHHFAGPELPRLAALAEAEVPAELGRLAFAQPVHGFDISSYQPAAPDFTVGGRRFGIFKATEGTGYFDPHFNANRAKAHAQGLPFIGLYHFARPGSHSPEAEASYFLAHVGPRQAGECAVLDYETSPWSVAWIVRWVQIVQGAGWPVEFYSYLGMLSANATAGIPETGCGLWIAAYGCREPGSDRWAVKDLWQHTDGAGSVCGNDGPWDCSIGERDRLVARVGGGPPPPPPPSQEEPVGASFLPVLAPGEEFTFRPPPAEGSGGIHFGAVYVSFGCDFGDPAVPGGGAALRLAVWDRTNGSGGGWVVLNGDGHYDASGKWVESNPQVPPLYVPTNGDVVAVRWSKNWSKASVVHMSKAGRIVPTVEYQAG